MVLLGYARLLIALVPLRLWRRHLGLATGASVHAGAIQIGDGGASAARILARHVERAAARLPFARKCLPRAMALSMLLRRRGIAHRLVFAVRPRAHAASGDRLHAWVEQAGTLLIGDEPGPWIEVLQLGETS